MIHKIRTEIEPLKWGCGCIIYQDNKVLMGKRCKAGEPSTWGFVGGKIEIGEMPIQAIIREINEETGLIPHEIVPVGEFIYEGVYDFIFLCTKFSGIPNPKLDEHSELKWYTIEEISTLDIFPFSKKAIELVSNIAIAKRPTE